MFFLSPFHSLSPPSLRSLFRSQKNPQKPFILSSLSLSHISLSFKACHQSSQRGKIGAMGHNVVRSARGVWRGLDGGGLGLGRWSMAATWGGLGWSVWVGGGVGLLGLGWFGLWVDLGMCGGVEAWRWWRLIGVDFSLCGLIGVGWSDVESDFSFGLIGMCWLIRFFFGF